MVDLKLLYFQAKEITPINRWLQSHKRGGKLIRVLPKKITKNKQKVTKPWPCLSWLAPPCFYVFQHQPRTLHVPFNFTVKEKNTYFLFISLMVQYYQPSLSSPWYPPLIVVLTLSIINPMLVPLLLHHAIWATPKPLQSVFISYPEPSTFHFPCILSPITLSINKSPSSWESNQHPLTNWFLHHQS